MRIKCGDIVRLSEITASDIVDYIVYHEQTDDRICKEFNYYEEAVALSVKRKSVVVALYASNSNPDFFFIIEIKRRAVYDVVPKRVDSPKTVCIDNWFWIVAGDYNNFIYMFSYLVYRNTDYKEETLKRYIAEKKSSVSPGVIKIKDKDFQNFAIPLNEDYIADDFIFKKFDFKVLIGFDEQIPEYRYNSEISRWECLENK